MKIQNYHYEGFSELTEQESLETTGGGDLGEFFHDFFYVVGATFRVTYELVLDNIEHPIGAAGGYPPR